MRIHADQPFYRDRAEPEQDWTGTLREVPVREGPATRELPFRLETDQGSQVLYAAGPVETAVRAWIGRRVTIRGKLIAQQDQGLPSEIWVGTILAAPELKSE